MDETGIMRINRPIKNRGNARGNPTAINQLGASLNTRQIRLLASLTEYDSKTIVDKSDVSMRDLASLTASTGDEYAMFSRGSKRLIIRGDSSSVNVDIAMARKLAKEGYKFSGHTHPGTD